MAAACRLLPGQVDLEGRPLPRLAVHVDEAVVLFDDAVNRRQPQAGALADFLGGEEGLEELCQRLFVHAAAVVADRQQDVPPGSRTLVGRAVVARRTQPCRSRW